MTATAELPATEGDADRDEEFDPCADPVPDGYELIDGELIEVPAMGAKAGEIAGKLFIQLDAWCERTGLGKAVYCDTGYRCFPGRPRHVRKPDVSLLLGTSATVPTPDGDYKLVPDLIVEVTSPRELTSATNARIEDFLAAGTKLVWVIYPDTRTARVFGPDGSGNRIRETESLTGGDLLPGFSVPLAKLFPPSAAD